MKTEVVLFDLGGVLVGLGGIEDFGRMIGEGEESEIWRRWLSSPSVRLYERGLCDRATFAADMVKENDLDISAEDFLEIFRAWPRGLFPGAEELVTQLPPEIRTGCLSNTNELHWNEQQDAERIQALFQRSFLSHEMNLVKPDREIFAAVLAELGCDAKAVLFLDDNQINIEGARALEIDAECANGIEGARAVLKARRLLG